MPIQKLEKGSGWNLVSSSFIQSPYSAVKELIENGIDATPKNINLEIDSKTGGCEYISVRDDGQGVALDDRDIMCLNHTTSKIVRYEDISESSFLGFRGEALFMLANLCNKKGYLEIVSRVDSENIGSKWRVDSEGRIKDLSKGKVVHPIGTTITLGSLFGGLRARYLDMSSKSQKTIAKIKHLLYHYHLLNPSIRFHFYLVSLKRDGSIVKGLPQLLSLPQNINLSRTLSMIIGLKHSTSIKIISSLNVKINEHLSIDLLLPLSRSDTNSDNKAIKNNYQFLAINSRPVSIQLDTGLRLKKMLQNIYKELELNAPLFWYLNIYYDPHLIDINIEPEKNDVLIKNISGLLENVGETIKNIIIQEVRKVKNDLDEYGLGDVPNNYNEPIDEHHTLTASSYIHPIQNLQTISHPSNDLRQKLPILKKTCTKDCSIIANTINNPTNNSHTTDSLRPSNNRKLTLGEITSEKIVCTLSMEDTYTESDSGSLEKNTQESLSSVDFNNTTLINEDLELSKDNSLSNPFILSKLKGMKKQKEMCKLERQHISLNSVENNNDKPNFSQKLTLRKLNKVQEETLFNLQFSKLNNTSTDNNKNNNKHIGYNNNNNRYKKRRLGMFSEFTNRHCQKLDYTGSNDKIIAFLSSYHSLANNSPISLISNILLDGLSSRLKDKSENVNLCLQKSPEGWLKYIPNSI
ncbi:hypothetical protein TBLA_0H00270 [Henningerozyma blattae CBS 6284]|uniref:DNA mismatch repair protein S5 domain-containing protein n=1 Tax=Henningerozyma blattae (strain ATCC 34711 / CBS 6284 / DSM 70876 / NBRC 10599 / NRRL Y-10934 / UCD 77-7) TaxID=1071380 RepID=I2H7G8_HENB6|nr:hypothetical protein TBLA_0H00270 [Tetrapisispora blattae CBS 6284]CCH62320.1 hypothetical protein TBLA_0H00270 [Tetrapisispora blattae CBS 6284]